ncbi:hypothetical protein [Ruminococcus sp. NK3A76]|uniref:hypothetical protein n=1 Tax=Ruminococcus sp. NK3A76 TaxID=877411 RepID=UPI000689ED73|nr:hypothetical protein [Ruminococcus sp. NK3A76]
MGRAGRGGGGGSRGGGFGGSRGFGSHSGSSFHSSSHSSYHSSSHSSRHSSGSSFASGYIIGSMVSGSNPRRRSVSGTSSSDKVGAIIFIIVFALYILAEVISSSAGSALDGGIQRSTAQREKLESSALVESDDYYSDRLGWIKSSKTLEDGMEYFYEQTGVQPFLVITDSIGGSGIYSEDQMERFANDVYDQEFEDEAHLVVVFYENLGEYHTCYVTGVEAKTVVDDEGGEILLDYLDHYYYSDLDEDEMFARAFRESADRMMTVTPSYGWIAVIIILIIIVLVISLTWWSKRKKAKLAELNKAQQIIDQDLNTFSTAGYQTNAGATVTNPGPTPPPDISGSAEVDELKKKYDNMNNDLM